MYGKLTDGQLVILDWRKPIVVDGVPMLLNDPALLLAQGWKQLTFSDPPSAGVAIGSWTETETHLIQTWTEQPAVPAEPTAEERIEALEAAMLELLEVMDNG